MLPVRTVSFEIVISYLINETICPIWSEAINNGIGLFYKTPFPNKLLVSKFQLTRIFWSPHPEDPEAGSGDEEKVETDGKNSITVFILLRIRRIFPTRFDLFSVPTICRWVSEDVDLAISNSNPLQRRSKRKPAKALYALSWNTVLVYVIHFPPSQILFWLVTQSFLIIVGEERFRDEPKERLRGRLMIHDPTLRMTVKEMWCYFSPFSWVTLLINLLIYLLVIDYWHQPIKLWGISEMWKPLECSWSVGVVGLKSGRVVTFWSISLCKMFLSFLCQTGLYLNKDFLKVRFHSLLPTLGTITRLVASLAHKEPFPVELVGGEVTSCHELESRLGYKSAIFSSGHLLV